MREPVVAPIPGLVADRLDDEREDGDGEDEGREQQVQLRDHPDGDAAPDHGNGPVLRLLVGFRRRRRGRLRRLRDGQCLCGAARPERPRRARVPVPARAPGPCGSPATRPSRPSPRTSRVQRRDRAGCSSVRLVTAAPFRCGPRAPPSRAGASRASPSSPAVDGDRSPRRREDWSAVPRLKTECGDAWLRCDRVRDREPGPPGGVGSGPGPDLRSAGGQVPRPRHRDGTFDRIRAPPMKSARGTTQIRPRPCREAAHVIHECGTGSRALARPRPDRPGALPCRPCSRRAWPSAESGAGGHRGGGGGDGGGGAGADAGAGGGVGGVHGPLARRSATSAMLTPCSRLPKFCRM